MSSSPDIRPLQVVVAGGGIAALETVLALHDLAADRVEITLIAPGETFSLRPLEVAQPFARGHARSLPLSEFAVEHRVKLIRAGASAIDAGRRVVTCTDGSEVAYDELVLALGATARPAFGRALTFGGGGDPLELNGVLADLDQGYSRSVAFVVPKGASWPLPLYELALMTAEEVYGMGMEHVKLHVVTPERSPLGIFGEEASASVTELLDAAGIVLHRGVVAEVGPDGAIDVGFGEPLLADRIVALPALTGPALPGVPSDPRGFIPVDDFCRVHGLEHVRAAGDATDQPVKQGGLACQQADVAAAGIAAAAGVDVPVEPMHPVLRGRLLTGHHDRFLRRTVGEPGSEATLEPLWWPPVKVQSRYLAPYLEERGLTELPMRRLHEDIGIDVRVPLGVGS